MDMTIKEVATGAAIVAAGFALVRLICWLTYVGVL